MLLHSRPSTGGAGLSSLPIKQSPSSQYTVAVEAATAAAGGAGGLGGVCHGFEAGILFDTEGTCDGPPPNALCEGQRLKTDCCNNVECRWRPSELASNDEELSGTCLQAGKTAFPNRPNCDWQYHQASLNDGDGATPNANALLQSNEQKRVKHHLERSKRGQ